MNSPYIVYSLSKGRTTQKFNKSKLQDILADIDIFMNNCTTTNFCNPNDIKLTAFTPYDETDPADVLHEIINKTTELFGLGNKEPIAYHYPSGEPHSASKHSWAFPKKKIKQAIQHIIDNSPMPKSSLGPLELFISYHFKLIDPISKQELPNQEHISDFCIWFSRSKSCSPTLFFPFVQANKEFWSYVDKISPFLPFKLEENYLRISYFNKHGEVKSFKKIDRNSIA